MASENPWNASEVISDAAFDNCEPSLAFVGASLHLVWNRSKTLCHSIYNGKAWSVPVRVASGEQPVLAAGSNGSLHCLFAHRFIGNYEIYHVTYDGERWSLPVPVSRTPGISTSPSLAVGPNGSLHAAWGDSTPGYSTIYHGTYLAPHWTSAPIPSGRGASPSIALTPEGDILVAWQDRLDEDSRYEILSSVFQNDRWSVPQIVSSSATAHSVRPQLLATVRGGSHMVWQEEAGNIYHVRHAERGDNGWGSPLDLSPYSDDCRLPHLARNRQDFLQTVWLEASHLRNRVRPPDREANWWPAESAPNSYGQLSELSMAIGPTGEAHVLMSCYTATGTRLLLHTRRQAVVQPVIISR